MGGGSMPDTRVRWLAWQAVAVMHGRWSSTVDWQKQVVQQDAMQETTAWHRGAWQSREGSWPARRPRQHTLTGRST